MQTKRKDVVLLNPKLPYPVIKAGGLNFHSRIWPPLELLNASSLLSELGIHNCVIDAHAKRMDIETTAEACKKAGQVVITTSTLDRWQCPYPSIPNLLETIKKIKEKNSSAEITLFGVHSTINPRRMLENYPVDKVVCGDESGIIEAVESHEFVIKSKETDLNAVKPDYSAIAPHDYWYEIFGQNLCLIETARGCGHHCSFCFKKMYGRYREKKIERVVQELEGAITKGYTHAYFIDLNFCNSRERVLELCDRIKKEQLDIAWTCQTRVDTVDRQLIAKMRSAGCKLIHLGIECNSSAYLKKCGKGTTTGQSIKAVRLCREAGIEALGFFLLGLPDQNAEDWKRTIRLAEKLDLDYASLTIATPYNEWQSNPSKTTYLSDGQLDLLKKMVFTAYLNQRLKPKNIAKALIKMEGGGLKILRGVLSG